MTVLGRIYVAQARKSLAIWLQYRVAMMIWMIGTIVQPVIYMVVWINVAEAQGGSVGGFTPGQFAAYYLVAMYVDHLTFTWIMWEYDWRIRQGEISRLLLLPVHPIHEDIVDNVVYKVLGLSVLLPATVVLVWTFQPELTVTAPNAARFLVALALAFAIRFLQGWALALVAFWTERNAAVNRMYFVTRLFFSGQLTPLALLPAPLLAIANVLPFRWYYAFPIELLLGRVSSAESTTGFLWQLLWLAVSFVLVRTMWRRGVRKYSAYGS